MNSAEAAELVRQMENSGFELVGRPHPRSPGFGGLFVAMRRIHTGRHYDPELIQLQLSDGQGYPAAATLHMDSDLGERTQVCPGQIEIADRVNKRIGFFTFGGEIDAARVEGLTIFTIRSPAPIVSLPDRFSDEMTDQQLASGTEALWARLRVRWGVNDAAFMRRMASIHPLELYAATLESLHITYQDSVILRQTFPEFYGMLRRELQWVQSAGGLGAMHLPLTTLMMPVADEQISP